MPEPYSKGKYIPYKKKLCRSTSFPHFITMPRDQQALAIRQHVLGLEHPNVAHSLNTLAALYRAQW
jgi:hypothetical protein